MMRTLIKGMVETESNVKSGQISGHVNPKRKRYRCCFAIKNAQVGRIAPNECIAPKFVVKLWSNHCDHTYV